MNQWDDLLNEAIAHDTLLRLSECLPNMIVQRVNGQKIWRVIEYLHPDNFPGMVIIRMVDQSGYDETNPCIVEGINDAAAWKLLGHYSHDAERGEDGGTA